MTASALLPDAVVRYGDHELAVVDLHLPPESNGSLVVLVHGGFWRQDWDRTHTRPQARALADLGYLVATPEYRRTGGGGGWPRTGDDVEAAVLALPDLLAGLGLHHDRTVLLGHSAGGHLVLWLCARPLAASVDLVVPLAPVADLVRADELDLDGGAVRLLLDGLPVTAADPMTLLTSAPPPAVVLVHGDRDVQVPLELSHRFVAAHPWAGLVELGGVDHFAFLDTRTEAWQVVTRVLAGQTGPR